MGRDCIDQRDGIAVNWHFFRSSFPIDAFLHFVHPSLQPIVSLQFAGVLMGADVAIIGPSEGAIFGEAADHRVCD